MFNTTASHRAYLDRRFFGSLDGLRALAILAVLWHHTVRPFAQLPITSRGFLGVDLFFVLSGYLIVTLILRERDRTGTISLRNFYMRRTLRIFPIYYTLLLLLSVLFFFVAPNSDMATPFRQNLPFYVTYTSNWVHDTSLLAITWSLATEEQFYLVWPPIEKWFRQWGLFILAVFLVINQLINFGLLFPAQHAQLEILQSTFTPICFGVVLAHVMHRRQGYELIAKIFGRKWSAPMLFVLLLLFINLAPLGTDISGAIRLTIHLLMVALLASCVTIEEHYLAPFLQFAPLVRIGAISYGMYLYHMLVRHAAGAILARLGLDNVPLALFFVTLMGTVIVAELSFRFYETPFLKLKKRWESKPAPVGK